MAKLPIIAEMLAIPLNCPNLCPAFPSCANSMPMLWFVGRNKCCPVLKIKSQISMTEKLGEQRPINRIPMAQKRLATAASRREHKKNKIAETKTTRKPGISLGNSRKPRWKSLMANVSLKKLLKVESTMLCENPNTNVAITNSWKSRGKLTNLFLSCWIILVTRLESL